MKKMVSLNFATIIAVTVFFYVTCYCLLHNAHISISSIIAHSHHLEDTKHLIVLGLLPIYISMMVFGAATLGIYLGTRFQHLFFRNIMKSLSLRKKQIESSPIFLVRK